HQRIESVTAEQRAGLARERIGGARHAERKPVLGIIVILMLGGGAVGFGKAVIAEDLAGAGGMRDHAVEYAMPLRVPVHAELEVMAQKPAALRSAERDRVTDAGALGQQRIGGALVVGMRVAQERDQVARRRKTDAGNLGIDCVVPELVDRGWRKFRAL